MNPVVGEVRHHGGPGVVFLSTRNDDAAVVAVSSLGVSTKEKA